MEDIQAQKFRTDYVGAAELKRSNGTYRCKSDLSDGRRREERTRQWHNEGWPSPLPRHRLFWRDDFSCSGSTGSLLSHVATPVLRCCRPCSAKKQELM